MNLTFSPEQLQRLFQYYIILDKNLFFLSCSDNILEHIEFVKDLTVADIFTIKSLEHPHKNLEINVSSAFLRQRVVLQLISDPQFTLIGQFEYIESAEQFLFYKEAQTKTEYSSDVEKIFETLPELVSYQHIINMIPSDISVFNIDRDYLFLNPAAERDSELRSWMIGKKDEDVRIIKNMPDKVISNRKQLFEKVIETKKSVSWEEAMIESGKTVYYLRTFYPVFNANREITLVIRYGVNVTDRKHIEKELLVKEKRYRDLYSFSPILIYSHSLTGKLLSCNPAVLNTLGYSEDEILDKNIQNLLPAYDREKVKKEYLDKINEEYYSEGIFRIVPKNGDKLVYLYYQNYKIVEEATSFIIGFSHNITARIKTEKKLRIAKLVAENLSKQKEIFLANMSHEIRTPINGILGLNNLLLKTNLDKQQEKYVKLSSESINNLLIIINDILDIEKIAFGKIDFERNPFNIIHKITRIVQLFQYKAKEKNLELLLDNKNISPDLVVNGDQYRLTQILSNLLSNAIKFSKTGSIQVAIRSTSVQDNQVTLEFSVKDTGIGIGKEDIAKIFKPFEQASLKTTRKYGGTGLGLSICKKLTEMQGGSIRVESELGKGTEFVFTLPYQINSRLVEEIDQTPIADFSRLAGKRILIGEDVELNQFLIENLLEAWGCEVEMVDNGIKIIEMHSLYDYDIILMDIQMPVMDGLTAAAQIRSMSDAKKANIPILAFTASVMNEDIQTYKKVQMNDYILKPYSDQVLYEKLVSVLYIGGNAIESPVTDMSGPLIESPSHDKLYDLSEIKALTAKDDRRLNKIVVMLIKTLSAEIENIKVPAAVNDWEQVSKIVHKMKASLIHIRVDSLKDILIDLEKNYSDYTHDELNSFLDQLCNTVLQVVSGLKGDIVLNEDGVAL